MNKKLSSILLTLLLLLVGCQDGGSGTGIPRATMSPPANPTVLDWHVQFSADSEVQLFRCHVLENIDAGTIELMDALNLRLTVVPITTQILEISQSILTQTNAEVGETIASLLENPTQLIVLMRLDFVTERDIYEPYRMMRPTLGDITEYSLSEIRFDFSNEAFTDDVINLQIGTSTYQPSRIPDGELQVGVIYPVYFEIDSEAFAALTTNAPTLSIDLGMLVPFKIDTCQTGNYRQFSLQPRIIAGTAHAIPSFYGNPGSTLSQDFVDEFRLEILSNVFPAFNRLTTFATPEATLEAESTSESEATVEPQSTP